MSENKKRTYILIHNDDKMFAIYEKHEIEEIIRYLKWALDGCKEG